MANIRYLINILENTEIDEIASSYGRKSDAQRGLARHIAKTGDNPEDYEISGGFSVKKRDGSEPVQQKPPTQPCGKNDKQNDDKLLWGETKLQVKDGC